MIRIIRTYGIVITAMAFWAFSYVWFKIANIAYEPITIVFFRLLLSVIFLSLYLIIARKFEKIRKEDRKYFFFIALCEPFFYFVFESYGLTYISSTVASVLIATIPVFTAIGALILFREKITLFNFAGIFISFVGLLIFVLTGDGNLSFNTRGMILMMMAVLSATGYSLILRRLALRYRPIYIVNVQNIIGLILFIPVFIIVDGDQIKGLTFNLEPALAIIKLAIFASCGAFILFGYAVRSMGVARANMFSNLIPVMTAIFAYFTIGEIITVEMFAGILVMIAGLYMTQITRPGRTLLTPNIEHNETDNSKTL